MNFFKCIYFKIQTILWTKYSRYKVASSGDGLKVNYKSHFTKNTKIGVDCHFNGISIVGAGEVVIGDHFHSGSDVLIITQSHNYECPNALPYDRIDRVKSTKIGKNCWIGSKVIVLPGTEIEEGVVVQAGSVLFGVIPKYSVVGGNPWRVIKHRDIERYCALDKKGVYVGLTDD